MITPTELIHAPQLAAILLLETAIHVACAALLAEHVELLAADRPLCGHSPDRATDLAERFLRQAHAMTAVLRDYQIAVAALFEPDFSSGDTETF